MESGWYLIQHTGYSVTYTRFEKFEDAQTVMHKLYVEPDDQYIDGIYIDCGIFGNCARSIKNGHLLAWLILPYGIKKTSESGLLAEA